MVAQDFFHPPPGPKCTDALYTALRDADSLSCSIESDFSFWLVKQPPTQDEITGICNSAVCKEVVDAMRKTASTECVTRDGYYLYKDLLNPIITKCATIAVAIPPPPLEPVGETPSNVTWTVLTPPPPPTRTTEPQTSSPMFGYVSTNNNNDGESTTVAVACASGVGFMVIVAIIAWIRQKNKRDTSVQKNQHLSYGNVGAFDTATPAAYADMEADDNSYSVALETTGAGLVYKPAEASAPTEDSSYYTTKNSSINTTEITNMIAPDLVPLLENQQITAVRLPFDKIAIGERLSAGSCGEVYRGTYKSDVVAIKRLLPQHRNDVRRIKSFLQEVQLMASLDHERIVTFVGVAWSSVSDICALSEFMSGGDLRSVLSQFHAQHKAVGFDQPKTKIALHVAHALTYLHSLQPVVLHRDLKSSNILLSSSTMDAKITDFGVSRERAESTMTRGVGTSLWMAPEVMNGGRYDEKADMFSFGVVLSELDTNKLPYATQLDLNASTSKLVEVMQRVALGRLTVEFSYASHPDIVALGRDCVAVDPAERPTAAEALHRVHQVWRHYS